MPRSGLAHAGLAVGVVVAPALAPAGGGAALRRLDAGLAGLVAGRAAVVGLECHLLTRVRGWSRSALGSPAGHPGWFWLVHAPGAAAVLELAESWERSTRRCRLARPARRATRLLLPHALTLTPVCWGLLRPSTARRAALIQTEAWEGRVERVGGRVGGWVCGWARTSGGGAGSRTPSSGPVSSTAVRWRPEGAGQQACSTRPARGRRPQRGPGTHRRWRRWRQTRRPCTSGRSRRPRQSRPAGQAGAPRGVARRRGRSGRAPQRSAGGGAGACERWRGGHPWWAGQSAALLAPGRGLRPARLDGAQVQ